MLPKPVDDTRNRGEIERVARLDPVQVMPVRDLDELLGLAGMGVQAARLIDRVQGIPDTAFTVAGPESPVIEREAGVARVGERSPELRGDQFLQPLEAGA